MVLPSPTSSAARRLARGIGTAQTEIEIEIEIDKIIGLRSAKTLRKHFREELPILVSQSLFSLVGLAA